MVITHYYFVVRNDFVSGTERMRKTINGTPDIVYRQVDRVGIPKRSTLAKNEGTPEKWPGWARALFMIAATAVLWSVIFWVVSIVYH